MFARKLPLFVELRRFWRPHDFRVKISHKSASKSSLFNEIEPSYEALSVQKKVLHKKLPLFSELRRFRRHHDLRAEI